MQNCDWLIIVHPTQTIITNCFDFINQSDSKYIIHYVPKILKLDWMVDSLEDAIVPLDAVSILQSSPTTLLS